MTEQADMPEAEAGTVADGELRTLFKNAGRGGGDPVPSGGGDGPRTRFWGRGGQRPRETGAPPNQAHARAFGATAHDRNPHPVHRSPRPKNVEKLVAPRYINKKNQQNTQQKPRPQKSTPQTQKKILKDLRGARDATNPPPSPPLARRSPPLTYVCPSQ